MAYVSEIITWADYEADVRSYLGITTGEDALLERLLANATGVADHWMANPFEEDGANTLEGQALNRVLQGCLDFIYMMYNLSGNAGPRPGVSSIKTGDLSEGYAASAVTKIPPAKQALDAAKGYWASYRKRIWR